MKKIAVTIFTLGFISSAFSQQPHCHTSEMNQIIGAMDPNYLQNIEAESNRIIAFGEQKLQTKQVGGDEIYSIPVVVHVVYSTTVENISDDQIISQLKVLNEDYRRLNADADETPSAFEGVAGDALIEFVFALVDPDGNPTTGITRTETDIASWNLFAPASDDNFAENVKDSDKGGVDGWDKDCYLNIWVADLGSSILGYASPPGSFPTSRDGVVIGYKWFGSGSPAIPPYNKGRTATHEVGHWLGLNHTWGDDGTGCGGSDLISDTPNQSDENYGCPSFPLTDACTPTAPGVMFMNYMDYTDDDCMNLFTNAQINKMRNVLESTREDIIACAQSVAIEEGLQGQKNRLKLTVYPNPSNGNFTASISTNTDQKITFQLLNTLGELIEVQSSPMGLSHNVVFNSHKLANGVYFIKAFDGVNCTTQQFILSK